MLVNHQTKGQLSASANRRPCSASGTCSCVGSDRLLFGIFACERAQRALNPGDSSERAFTLGDGRGCQKQHCRYVASWSCKRGFDAPAAVRIRIVGQMHHLGFAIFSKPANGSTHCKVQLLFAHFCMLDPFSSATQSWFFEPSQLVVETFRKEIAITLISFCASWSGNHLCILKTAVDLAGCVVAVSRHVPVSSHHLKPHRPLQRRLMGWYAMDGRVGSWQPCGGGGRLDRIIYPACGSASILDDISCRCFAHHRYSFLQV